MFCHGCQHTPEDFKRCGRAGQFCPVWWNRLHPEPAPKAKASPLNERQTLLLRRWSEGNTYAMMAKELHVSPQRISSILDSVRDKLYVSSLDEAARRMGMTIKRL